MSEFLNKLRDTIIDLEPAGTMIKGRMEVYELIDSLGENARRMLDIGIIQDELVKMRFKQFEEEGNEPELMQFNLSIGNDQSICVFFDNYDIKVGISMFWCNNLNNKYIFEYSLPTLRQDLINYVRELINA